MTQPTTLYKVLSKDGRSCHGGSLQWPLPTQHPDGTWTPGETVRVEGEIVPCENGIHLATARQVVAQWLGARVWVTQWQGELVDAGGKWVAREVRLLHGTAWDDRIARHFAADCAHRALTRVKATDPRSWAAIKAARLFADAKIGDAARAAAGDAAGAAARAAAWAAARAAAWDAAGAAAGAAARDAAGDAAGAAAGAAAWDAARAAARDAAWAAAGAAEIDWQTERFEYYLKGGQPEAYE